MAITREELKQRVLDIKQGWLDDHFEKNVDRILDSGQIDFENSPCNYKPAYPIVAAILERCADSCIYGSSYETVIRQQKKQKNKLKSIVII